MNKRNRVLCLCLILLLVISLAACNSPTDEQNSDQPTPSVQPTLAPTPTPPPIPFTDVAQDSPYYDAVVWAYENGIASDGETFGPADACTRGQAMTFLWRAMGSPEPQMTENPVSDISPSNWFYKPVLWAYESGISTSSSFKPNNPCTNGEALTFLWRAEGRPMAALGSSAIALAAPNQYFTRPVAWAETNGLLSAEVGFNPSANCLRADLMSYLYWAEGQRASAKESRALQAEYEKIIQDAKLYEVHGSGLFYADYIDVDGEVGLLTVGIDWDSFTAIATVYADMGGHAGKCCEQTFGLAGTFTYLNIYQADGQLYLGIDMEHRYEGMEHQFFKVENGAFVCNDHVQEKWDISTDSLTTRYISINGEDISEDEYRATVKKYTEQTKLFSIGPAWYEFGERGILPNPGVQVNGAAVNLSAKPYYSMFHEDIMVPLRDVLEAMGVAVYANPDASAILASTKSDTLAITYKEFEGYGFEGINSDYYGRDKTYQYSMNGGEFQNFAIEFTDGKAFVPLQTIVPLFGGKAEWNGKAGAMQITSNISDSSRMSQDELKKMANFDLEKAQGVATSKGYEYTKITFWANDGYTYGVVFKHGKAIWKAYFDVSYIYEKDEYGNIVGLTIEEYPIEIVSDGTVTEYPNDVIYRPSSQY